MAKDNEIKNPDVDNFDLDLGLDGDFGFEEEGGRLGSRDRKPIESIKSGIKQGIKDNVTPGRLTELLRKALPKEYGNATDEIGGYATDTRKILTESVGQIAKDVNTVRASIARMQPSVEKLIGNGKIADILKKIGKKPDTNNYRGELSEQEQDNVEIANQLAEFRDTQEASVALQKQVFSNDLIRTETERKRFESQQEILGGIFESLRGISNFQNELTAKFYQKNLEIGYRQLFTQQRTLQLLREDSAYSRKALESIVKNTGLPDYVKLHKSEAMGEVMLRNSITKMTEGFSDYIGNFRERLMKNVATRVKEKLNPLNFMAEMSGQMEMMAEMAAMEKEMAESMGGDTSKAYRGSKFGTKLLLNPIGNFVANQVNKRYGVGLRAGGKRLERFTKNIPQQLNQLSKDGYAGYGIKGYLINELLSLIPQASQKETSFEYGTSKKLTDPALFDNATRKSIVDIIPELLSSIHLSTEGIRKSLNPNQILNEGDKLEWDYSNAKLSTRKTLDEDYLKKNGLAKDMEQVRLAAARIVHAFSKSTYLPRSLQDLLINELVLSTKNYGMLPLDKMADPGYRWQVTFDNPEDKEIIRQFIIDSLGLQEDAMTGELVRNKDLSNKQQYKIESQLAKAEDYYRELINTKDGRDKSLALFASVSDLDAARLQRLGLGRTADGVFTTKVRDFYNEENLVRYGGFRQGPDQFDTLRSTGPVYTSEPRRVNIRDYMEGSLGDNIRKETSETVQRFSSRVFNKAQDIKEDVTPVAQKVTEQVKQTTQNKLDELKDLRLNNNYTVQDVIDKIESYDLPPEVKEDLKQQAETKAKDFIRRGHDIPRNINDFINTFDVEKIKAKFSSTKDTLKDKSPNVREALSGGLTKPTTPSFITNLIEKFKGMGTDTLKGIGMAGLGSLFVNPLLAIAGVGGYNLFKRFTTSPESVDTEKMREDKRTGFNERIKALFRRSQEDELYFDIYVRGENEPRLLSSKLKQGLYRLAKDDRPVYKVKDIDDTVIDVSQDPPEVVITRADILKGLIDYNGEETSAGIIDRIRTASSLVKFNPIEITRKIYNKTLSKTMKTTDMYNPETGEKVVSRWKMMRGGYRNGDGKTIESVKDIGSGIYDAETGEELYSEKDIKDKPLVDKKGRKVKGYVIRRLRWAWDMSKALYKYSGAKLLVNTATNKLIKGGLNSLSNAKNVLTSVIPGSNRLGGIKNAIFGSRVRTIDGRVIGRDNDGESEEQNEGTSVLGKLASLFKPKRKGNWEDEQKAQDQATKQRREEDERRRKEELERKEKQRGTGILGLLSKSFPLLLGALGAIGTGITSVVSTIAGLGTMLASHLFGGIFAKMAGTAMGTAAATAMKTGGKKGIGFFGKMKNLAKTFVSGKGGKWGKIALGAATLYGGYKLFSDDGTTDEDIPDWQSDLIDIAEENNKDKPQSPEQANAQELDEAAEESSLPGWMLAMGAKLGISTASKTAVKTGGAMAAKAVAGRAVGKGMEVAAKHAAAKVATKTASNIVGKQVAKLVGKTAVKATAGLAGGVGSAVAVGAMVAGPAGALVGGIVGFLVNAYLLYDTARDIWDLATIPNKIEDFKAAAYGINPENTEHVQKIIRFEEKIYELAKIDDEGNVNLPKIEDKELASLLTQFMGGEDGLDYLKTQPESEQANYTASWINWFNQRFLPAFERHVKALHEIDPKAKLPDIYSRMGTGDLKHGLINSWVKRAIFPPFDEDNPYFIDYDPFLQFEVKSGQVPNRGVDYDVVKAYADIVIDAFKSDEIDLRKKDAQNAERRNKLRESLTKMGKTNLPQEYKSYFDFEKREQADTRTTEEKVRDARDALKKRVLNNDGTRAQNVTLKGNTLYIEGDASKINLEGRSIIDDLMALRLRMYGLNDLIFIYAQAMLDLESYFSKLIIFKDNGEPELPEFDRKVVGDKFATRFKWTGTYEFLQWLDARFLPVYMYFVKLAYEKTRSNDLTVVENLPTNDKYSIGLKLSQMSLPNGRSIWDIVFPFSPDIPMNTDPASIKDNLENLQKGLENKILTENTKEKKTDKNKINWVKVLNDAQLGRGYTPDALRNNNEDLTRSSVGLTSRILGGNNGSMYDMSNVANIQLPDYGKPSADQLKVAEALYKEMDAAGFTEEEKIQFLAQVTHESNGLKNLKENWKYRDLQHLWSKGAGAVFEAKYGMGTRVGRNLGNTQPGDGAKYYGRGPIQITGRANYEKIAKIMNIPIVDNPDLVATDPTIAAKAAIGWWLDRKSFDKSFRNAIASGDPVGVSKGVNRYDTEALPKRIAQYNAYKQGNGYIQKLMKEKGGMTETTETAKTITTNPLTQPQQQSTPTTTAALDASTTPIGGVNPASPSGVFSPMNRQPGNTGTNYGYTAMDQVQSNANYSPAPTNYATTGEGTDKAGILQQATSDLVDIGKKVTRLEGSAAQGGMDGLNPDYRKLLYAMLGEYYTKTGKSMTITSAYRSPEYQQSLKAGDKSGNVGGKGSYHVKGQAVDFAEGMGWGGANNARRDLTSGPVNELFNSGIPYKWGFTRPLLFRGKSVGGTPSDPSRPWETWHVENKLTGGREDSFLVPSRRQDPNIVGKNVVTGGGSTDSGSEDENSLNPSMSPSDPMSMLTAGTPLDYKPTENPSTLTSSAGVVPTLGMTMPPANASDVSGTTPLNGAGTTSALMSIATPPSVETPPLTSVPDKQTQVVEAQQQNYIEAQKAFTENLSGILNEQLSVQRDTRDLMSRLVDIIANQNGGSTESEMTSSVSKSTSKPRDIMKSSVPKPTVSMSIG